MRQLFLCTSFSILLLLLAAPQSLLAEKPNIIFILADDSGFSDLGCYGSEIQTPHLDGLAKNGLMFTQFYNTGALLADPGSFNVGLLSSHGASRQAPRFKRRRR